MGGKNEILIIGRPETGKSCLKGQLFTRLSELDLKVSLDKTPDDITAIKKIISSQARGINPERTSKENDVNTILNLRLEDGTPIEMIWPDSAGEKTVNIVNKREVPLDWESKIKESTIWLLFIRLDKLKSLDTLLDRFGHSVDSKEDLPDFEVSDYSFFIELLQILLYVRGVGTKNKVRQPVLQVCLSFWDELGEVQTTPKEELMKRCPLLVNYIDSQWEESKAEYLGVSPQGMKLAKEPKDAEKNEQLQDFIDAPEDYGYVIKANGEKEEDLTYLIQNAVNLL